MKRYSFFTEMHEGRPRAIEAENPDGLYVLHSEAQEDIEKLRDSLTVSEQRNEELRGKVADLETLYLSLRESYRVASLSDEELDKEFGK